MWTRRLRGFGFDETVDAIERHRSETTLNMPNLEAVCVKLGIGRQKRAVAKREAERIIDWLRKQDKDSGVGKYFGWSDTSALTDHFAAAWIAVRDSPHSEQGKQYIRALIFDHCRKAFTEIKFPATDSDDMARTCVELGPGEQILTGRILRPVDAMAVSE